MAALARSVRQENVPTDAQPGALMLDIADRGWPAGSGNPEIDPETARMVAHDLSGEMLQLSRSRLAFPIGGAGDRPVASGQPDRCPGYGATRGIER